MVDERGRPWRTQRFFATWGRSEWWRESCKRQTKCRLCNAMMAKGETRLVVKSSLPNPRKCTNGGTQFNTTLYYHPRCFAELVLGDETQTEARCYGCNRKFHDSKHRHRQARVYKYTRTSERHGFPICRDCADNRDLYVECMLCRWIVARAFSSPSVEMKGRHYCHFCADLHKPPDSLRIIRREERQQKWLDDKIEKIREEYRSNGL